jgi:hypothetical protein
MKKTFSSYAIPYFRYLMEDYGFALTKIEDSESKETEGRVEFETPVTFVTVSGETWTTGAVIGRVKDDRYRYFLDPETIHEYLALTEADRELVLSPDPGDDRRARRILSQISLSTGEETSGIDLSRQLSSSALWLRRYAGPFLRGDFTQWLQIYEYKVLRARAASLRAGKEELVRTIAPDERVSVFKGSLEYLDRLRKEKRET